MRDILLLNVKDYVAGGPDLKINLIVFAITLGLIAGTIIMSIYKKCTVTLLRKLIRKEAFSEESAKTLAELRLADSILTKRSLSKRGQITEMVCRVGEKTYTYEEYVALQKERGFKEEKINFEEARFYIRPEKLNRATHVYESENPTVLRTALSCIFLFAVCVCICLIMPWILELVAKIIK